MIKKCLLGLTLVILVSLGYFHSVGSGMFGGSWSSESVTSGPRPAINRVEANTDAASQILFGDLHTHTNYSIDAAIFNTQLVKGLGRVTPADACDFARYCSALDFWSINDHAESLTPAAWADTVKSIRLCNAEAGDASNPDMVSFVGWEWSNSDRKDAPNHYGHKNVIFRSWEEGETPTRPIAAQGRTVWHKIPSVMIGLISMADSRDVVNDLGWYLNESGRVPVCDEELTADRLPESCREVAATPSTLYRKLDEWGLDSMVIPHGLAWGTTNPSKADFRDQLQGYQARYEKLIETYSGHGSSEIFEDFQRVGRSENGGLYCPEATENFTPCCQQAGSIVRSRCADSTSAACAAEVDNVVAKFLAKGVPAGRDIVPDTSLNDWAGCGQLENQFQPASMYVPRNSTQYALALGFDAAGNPKQTRFGLIGSSDNHVARPGNSYKETNRILYTDNKDVGRTPMFQRGADSESGGFYYTGGLVAVHSQGRHRDAIWNGLNRRQVYATSGDRILVWFDLLNGPEGAAPMGSEVVQEQSPRFKVSALGALAQRPGCPDSALAALGADRIESLCGGQCYSPGNRRKAITRIEIVRIRPQLTPDEKIAPLVESPWRIHECPEGASECTYQFEDEEFLSGERPSLYYARVIQEAEPLISGDPFGCVYDEAGACVERNYCVGEYATATENCLHIAEPRAWTSPIYLNVPNAAGDH